MVDAVKQVIDSGSAVRKGEELDTQAVTAWLRTQGLALSDTLELTQFSGGASNWTYRLKYPEADLILRRPPKGTKAKGAHDMGREYRIQSLLKPVYPHVPRMVGHCADESVIGSEFYVMERIEGIIPALETAHAFAVLGQLGMKKDEVSVICLSGRGDKDLGTYMNAMNEQ